MRSGGVGAVFMAARPLAEECVHERANGLGGFATRAEVETLTETRGLRGEVWLTQAGTQPEVAGERFEHVLPRTGGPTIADDGGLAGLECAYTVRDNTVGREVTATDDVASAARGECSLSRRRTERTAPGRDEEFRHAFRGAVWIVAAHRFVFTIAFGSLAVLVALVRGHNHHRRRRSFGADGIK
jgi:hypothetical protein